MAWMVVVARSCVFSSQGAAEVLVSWFGRRHRVVLVGLTTHEVALYTAEQAFFPSICYLTFATGSSELWYLSTQWGADALAWIG